MNNAVKTEFCEFASDSEIIPSISIENLLVRAAYAMQVFTEGMDKLSEAQQLMKEVTSGKVYDYVIIAQRGIASTTNLSCLKEMKRKLDAGVWDRLMHDTGMKTLMSNKQIEEWDKQLNSASMPEATLDNILASFRALQKNKGDIFEQGVIDLFKKLSWDYKTNNPCKIGKKIIVNRMVGNSSSKNCYFPTDEGRNQLNDLEKMMSILDGKKIPDHRVGAGEQFYFFASEKMWSGESFEHDYFSVKYFKTRTGHIFFKRPDLVDKLNDIIGRKYGQVLPARV